MAERCLFCRIVDGEVPSSLVFEDAATVAVMDLRQTNPGHVLVLPRHHVATLDETPPDVAAALMQTVVRMTGAVRRAFEPDGVNIWQSNGVAAGQEVFHVHVHVFPRWTDDGHFRIYPGRAPDTARETLDELAHRLRQNL
jgi:histidine triad (HIT) family protein